MSIMEPRAKRFGGILTVDLAALAKNYALLCRHAGAARCAGVVKADAYGIGLQPAVETLKDAGCTSFFTATIDEALEVRALSSSAQIFVLCGPFPGTEEYFLNNNLIPVLNDYSQLEQWTDLSRHRPPPPAALHLDTGMNRLGLPPAEVPRLAADTDRLQRLNLVLVMSHLASGDNPEAATNQAQQRQFAQLAAQLPRTQVSLANSSGIFLGPAFHHHLARPGISLYGGAPFPAHKTPALPKNPMHAVVHLAARIIQIRDIPKGADIGYGATFRAERAMRIAATGLGYADGFLRRFSQSNRDGASLNPVICGKIAGHRVPVVGRVSMDLTLFDVSDVPIAAIKSGDLIDLFGDDMDIDILARAAGTISNELLTSLGRRYYRHYLPAPAVKEPV